MSDDAPIKKRLTASDVCAGLRKSFGATETGGRYTILFEVSNATGFSRNRSADAVIMSCWPSDGLELHGVEIKVARHDWLNERKNPKKAEDIAQFCDRWWLVTTPGVVADESEIPEAWGWRVWDGKALKTMKQAARTEAKPPTRAFLGSVLRNAGKLGDGAEERLRRSIRDGLEAEVERRVTAGMAHRTPDRLGKVMAQIEAFEKETGIKLVEVDSWGWRNEGPEEGQRLGRIFNAVSKSTLSGNGYARDEISLALAFQSMHQCLEAMKTVAEDCGITLPEPPKTKRRKS